MGAHRRIPGATVARLPVYQRVLTEMAESHTATVFSKDLAELAGVNAAKVRKDLSHLGSYGTRGAGYDVEFLLMQIGRELGLNRDWPVVIVGIGNLGRGLANSHGFSSGGFRVAALVDSDPDKVGVEINGVAVRHFDDLAAAVTAESVTMAVIATPAPIAQEVCDRLVEAGVGSILNFAPTVLTVPDHVLLRQVDLSIELRIMSFYQSRQNGGRPSG